jgi:hypothetical protein
MIISNAHFSPTIQLSCSTKTYKLTFRPKVHRLSRSIFPDNVESTRGIYPCADGLLILLERGAILPVLAVDKDASVILHIVAYT